jgi:hypothetical protein
MTDRDQEELAELLHLSLEVEQWREMKVGIADWLVWLSIPLWCLAVWPGRLPSGLHHLVVAVWVMLCAVFLVVGYAGWKRLRRIRILRRHLAARGRVKVAA